MRNSSMPLCRLPSISPGPRRRQILFGDDKAVIGVAHGLEPRLGGLAQGLVIDQEA